MVKRHLRWLRFLVFGGIVFIVGTLSRCSNAEQPDEAGIEFFESKIRPILVEHCYQCHATDSKQIQGGLLLDTREGIQLGGDSGAAVTPGKLEESLLLDAIKYETFEMPPEAPLPKEVIADFEHWIRMGAPDPRDEPMKKVAHEIDIETGRQFWSFQPLRSHALPTVNDSQWPRTSIDQFILARLETEGLKPSTDADRVTLIRRAYNSLIGLPPSTDEIDQFANDPASTPEAFATVVDRLLASPHFGERWGRHWLDVVRFAESSGGGRSLLFPEAWRYRDYVIQAFNDNVPYDHFIKQQIAGDLIESTNSSERQKNLIATAFLLLGPTNYEQQDKDVLEMDIVDEQLDTIGKSMLGMTIGCARCHDHKFDPIPTRDYYALAGIMKSTLSVIHENVSKWNTAELPLSPKEKELLKKNTLQIAELRDQLDSLRIAFKNAGGDLATLEKTEPIDLTSLKGLVIDDTQAERKGKWTSSRSVNGFVGKSYLFADEGESSITYSPKLPESGLYEVRMTYTPHGNRSPNVPVRIYHTAGESVVHLNQTEIGTLQDRINSLGTFEFDASKQPRVVVSNIGAAPGAVIADAIVFIRKQQTDKDRAIETLTEDISEQADHLSQLTEQINVATKQIKQLQDSTPETPSVMAVTDIPEVSDIPLAIRGVVSNVGPIIPRGVLQVALQGNPPEIPSSQSGRVQLAEWIASPQNPLTARVIVNRIWNWQFGQGLVPTADNFGSTGEPPTHPELLDHLATQFIEDGWSIKKLIRRIMLSRVYQLSSKPNPAAQAIDPANKLYWRMNRQRLDVESLRDTLLLLGGNLDLTIGGTNIKDGTSSEYGYQFDSTRRSVYEPVFRNSLSKVFETFDFADPNIQVGSRNRSTTAPQALLLMNDPGVMQQASSAAKKLLEDQAVLPEERVQVAYRRVLGRLPSEQEAAIAQEFIGDSDDPQRWAALYHTLIQSLDFRFIE